MTVHLEVTGPCEMAAELEMAHKRTASVTGGWEVEMQSRLMSQRSENKPTPFTFFTFTVATLLKKRRFLHGSDFRVLIHG